MNDGPINTIKDALVKALQDNAAPLGIRTVRQDITPDALADKVAELAGHFPLVIVNYAGRGARREGTTLITDPLFSVVVAARSVAAPGAAVPKASALCDALLDFLDGKNLAPRVQKSALEFAGDQLEFQDKILTVYQLMFRTQVLHLRR